MSDQPRTESDSPVDVFEGDSDPIASLGQYWYCWTCRVHNHHLRERCWKCAAVREEAST